MPEPPTRITAARGRGRRGVVLLRPLRNREQKAEILRRLVGGAVDTRDPDSVTSDAAVLELLDAYDYIVLPMTLPEYGSLRLAEYAHQLRYETRLVVVTNSRVFNNDLELFDQFHGPELRYEELREVLERPVRRFPQRNRIDAMLRDVLSAVEVFHTFYVTPAHPTTQSSLPLHPRPPTLEEYRSRLMGGGLPRKNNPWVSGSFYRVAALAVVLVFAAIARVVSVWVLPPVIIGGILTVAVVGALQLRNDSALSERTFRALMIEALKRLPLLSKNKPARGQS